MSAAGVGPGRVPAAGTFDARRAVAYTTALFAGGLGLSVLYASTGIGVSCPFRAATGWECPFCGGTRMGAALLHGDIVAAVAFNPVAVVGLAVLGVLGIAWLVEMVGGPVIRPPARLRARLSGIARWQWLVATTVLAVAYTVVRNLI